VTPADRAVVDRWWQELLATGRPPAELAFVQQRLVRAVYRGELPSGAVHVKVMTFPRAKDRVRYLLRPLPAVHEARMLRALAAAGVPCPEVIDVRTARRQFVPFRSLLVMRTLAVAGAAAAPRERLRREADFAVTLLAAGVVHRDLHTDNFVALADGRLAVLDLQSASRWSPARADAAAVRVRTAARLVRDRPGLDDAAALAELRAAGLVRDDAEQAAVRARVVVERARYVRSRIMRCLGESTEFTRRWRWSGSEHRLRAGLGAGRWWAGGRELRDAWLGQRVLQLDRGRPLAFSGYFRRWWWLGGAAALYVREQCGGDRIHAELREAAAAWKQFASSWPG
jgi:tRNA A-37 threonylcarbamoyl transferase component Bud32